MVIRTLNQDINHNSLEVFRGNDGDIYVTVWERVKNDSKRIPHNVRIGSAGSGHQLPSGIMAALSNLAAVFEKYKDCETEADALREEQSRPFRMLDKRDVGMIQALIKKEGPIWPSRLAEFFGIPEQMLSMLVVRTDKKQQEFLTVLLDYDVQGRIQNFR